MVKVVLARVSLLLGKIKSLIWCVSSSSTSSRWIMRNQSEEKKFREDLYLKYGKYISMKPDDLPEQHRCKLNGGLRCFKKVSPRDEEGVKIPGGKKKRCGHPTIRGSLFCRKHGGGNTSALTTGTAATAAVTYRNMYHGEFKNLLDAFMNDPKIIDLKPELGHLRTIMLKYIEKLTNARPKSPKVFVLRAMSIVNSEDMTYDDRVLLLSDLVSEQVSITDGRAIDRINRTVDTIGKTIDRIHKIQSREEFMLTPEGLKIMLRAIVEIIKARITDESVRDIIRKDLMGISIMTKGDISAYEMKNKDRTHDVIDVEPLSDEK